MRYISRALLPGALGFAVALLVAGCGGGSGLFSGEEANNLNKQLNTVAAAIDGGRCNAADQAARDFDNSVSNLTAVNTRLQQNLKQASSALAAQARSDCQSRQAATAPSKPTKTSTSPANTTPTRKTPTSTAPTTTSPATSTSPTTPTPPATTGTGTGTTSSSGGAGLTGTGTSTGPAGSGGASAGNGNGNAQ